MLTWLIDTNGDWVLTIVRVVLGVVLFAHERKSFWAGLVARASALRYAHFGINYGFQYRWHA